MLLTGSNDKTLRLWDNNTGKCIQTYIRHNEIISACAWLPCGTKFVSGSVDKFVYLWNINGDIIHKWSGMRIHDLAITKCGEKMIAMSEKRVVVFSIKNLSPSETDSPILQTLIESDSITSMTISRDSKYLLVNMSTQEIHLWDIELQKIIKKYNGHKQGRFVIRSSFAGVDENFVICGSDDSLIYVWHRERAEMISYLQGHDGCVNSVSWSSIGNMFASASDDGTVRVWT